MARYREKILPLAPTLILLAFAFIIACAPWAPAERELSWREGFTVLQAQDMQFAPLPLVTVHGEAIPNVQPLFPLLAKTLQLFGCPPEISARILSMAGLLGLAAVVFAVTYQAKRSLPAAACAGTMMLTTLLVIDKAPDGFAHTLLALTIFTGHLLWYYFAALKGSWSRAWATGLFFCAVGFYLQGIAAVVLFLLPLIFMRRPLGIFQHLSCRGMFAGLGLLALATLLWYLPYSFDGVQMAEIYPQADWLSAWEYLLHLLFFPWDLLSRLLPWVLISWAPFCVSFQMIDETPMFSRFLRTLFFANFFLLWALPMDESYEMMILLPPLAVMTGLNYELAVRRYGNFYRRISNIFAAVLLPGCAIVLLVFFLLPADMLEQSFELARPLDFSDTPGRTVMGVTAGCVLLTVGISLWRMREKPPVWCYWLIIAAAPLLVYGCIVQPYQALDRPRQERGEMLRQALRQENVPADTVIYKYDILDLFAESVYMKYPVQKISSLTILPKAEVPVVYVLSKSFPNLPERTWRSLLPESLYSRGSKFNLWRGEWQHQIEEPAPRKQSPLLEVIKNPPSGRIKL